MKKSKIIGLTAGFIGMAGMIFATPFIITSCNSNSTEENNLENSTVSNNVVSLSKEGIAQGYKLIHEPNSNVFKFYSNKAQWSIEDLKFLNIAGFEQDANGQGGIFNWVSKEQLEKLGFDKKLLEMNNLMDPITQRGISMTIGIRDTDGKIKYPPMDYIDFENWLLNADKNNEFTLVNSFKVCQLDNKKFQEELGKLENPTPQQVKEVFQTCAEKDINFNFKFMIYPKQN